MIRNLKFSVISNFRWLTFQNRPDLPDSRQESQLCWASTQDISHFSHLRQQLFIVDIKLRWDSNSDNAAWPGNGCVCTCQEHCASTTADRTWSYCLFFVGTWKIRICVSLKDWKKMQKVKQKKEGKPKTAESEDGWLHVFSYCWVWLSKCRYSVLVSFSWFTMALTWSTQVCLYCMRRDLVLLLGNVLLFEMLCPPLIPRGRKDFLCSPSWYQFQTQSSYAELTLVQMCQGGC